MARPHWTSPLPLWPVCCLRRRLNFSAGNLLSIYSPKKVDYSSFGRQRASQTTVLISLGVQLFVIGVGVAAFWIARFYGNLWIATLIFLLLAGNSISAYVVILSRMDSLAIAAAGNAGCRVVPGLGKLPVISAPDSPETDTPHRAP